MIQLKEALIGRTNSKNADIVDTLFQKRKLRTGDLIVIRNNKVGMFIEGKDISSSAEFIDGVQGVLESTGMFVFYTGDGDYQYCDPIDYDENLTCSYDKDIDIIGIIPNYCNPNLRKNKKIFSQFFGKIGIALEDLIPHVKNKIIFRK